MGKVVCFTGGWRRRVKRGWTGVSIAVMGLAPFLMLIPLAALFHSEYLDFFVLLFALWIVVIAANALVATRLPALGVVVLAVLVVGWAYISLPLILSRPHMVPTTVASYLGIRGEQAQKLLVLRQTCELVNSAIASAGAKGVDKACVDPWNELSVQVLSNVGDRWLVELDAPGTDGTMPFKLKLTISRSDLQVLSQSSKSKKLGNSRVCT